MLAPCNPLEDTFEFELRKLRNCRIAVRSELVSERRVLVPSSKLSSDGRPGAEHPLPLGTGVTPSPESPSAGEEVVSLEG